MLILLCQGIAALAVLFLIAWRPEAFLRTGLALVLLLAPTQWALNLGNRAMVSAIDPLIAMLVLAWTVDRLKRFDFAWRVPPVEHWALFLLAGWSIGVAEDRMEAIKTTFQVLLYFVAAHTLFFDRLRRDGVRALRAGLWWILVPAALNLVLAGIQYFGPDSDPMSVRGAFSNRNVFGAYMAWLLPLCAGMVGFARDPRMRLAAALLLAAGLLFTLSGAALLAVGLAVSMGMLLTGRRIAFAALLAGGILLLDQGLPRLPRANDQALLDSLALYELQDHEVRVAFRYPEWQAAGVLMLEYPWRGVGAGNYQRQINRYYGIIPNPTGPQTPDVQNLFLVLGVSLGFPGLAAFFAMLMLGLRNALQSRPRDASASMLRWGGAGAIAAMAITGIWTPWMVRGILPLLAALLAALHWLNRPPEPEDAIPSDRDSSPASATQPS